MKTKGFVGKTKATKLTDNFSHAQRKHALALHTLARARAHTHTHTRSRTRTHTHTRARANTYTQYARTHARSTHVCKHASTHIHTRAHASKHARIGPSRPTSRTHTHDGIPTSLSQNSLMPIPTVPMNLRASVFLLAFLFRKSELACASITLRLYPLPSYPNNQTTSTERDGITTIRKLLPTHTSN